MWQLQKEENDKRVYVNSTGSKCTTQKVYTDREGNNWWGFSDLFTLPFTRSMAANKVSSLYLLGFTKDDLSSHITGLKTILKSEDKEKYEKAFSLVLDFESKAYNATDPIKQMSLLVPVYFCMNDEEIDSYEGNFQLKKMGLLEADTKMHCFFLSKQIPLIENYMNRLGILSQTALVPLPELPGASQ